MKLFRKRYSDDLALTDFFTAQEFFDSHAIESGQFDNFLSRWKSPGALPASQSCSWNTCFFCDFDLREAFLLPQIVQPCSIRISSCFWSSTHAPASIVFTIAYGGLLVINDHFILDRFEESAQNVVEAFFRKMLQEKAGLLDFVC